MDDWRLLRHYAERKSEAAFEALVKRHVDMVHSAALRQVRDAHLAQDVTQAVFILLARKAASLRPSVILSGWLYRTTVHVASRALRDHIRQQRREQEAATMIVNEPADELWAKLAPHLLAVSRRVSVPQIWKFLICSIAELHSADRPSAAYRPQNENLRYSAARRSRNRTERGCVRRTSRSNAECPSQPVGLVPTAPAAAGAPHTAALRKKSSRLATIRTDTDRVQLCATPAPRESL